MLTCFATCHLMRCTLEIVTIYMDDMLEHVRLDINNELMQSTQDTENCLYKSYLLLHI